MAKTNYSALNLSRIEKSLADGLEDRISEERRFTYVPQDGGLAVAERSIAFVIDQLGEIKFLGRIKRSMKIATVQRRLTGDQISEIGPVPIGALSADVQAYFQEHSSKPVFPILENIAQQMRADIERVLPDSVGIFQNLDDLVNRRERTTLGNKEAALEQQKDATLLALKISGLHESEGDVAAVAVDTERVSFLKSLGPLQVSEDQVLAHDAAVFSDWSRDDTESVQGVAEFVKGDKSLTIVSANREALESVFGVDLIYVDAARESATFVQYKLMDQRTAKKEDYFNPASGRHNVELQRMRKVQNFIDSNPQIGGGIESLRAVGSPLFFKLCTKTNLKKEEHNVAIGMYIPLDHWEVILADPKTDGPRGGKQIGFHTVEDKYLTTTQFVELLKKNLVGTTASAWPQISRWIRDLLRGRRAVIVAIEKELTAHRF